MTRLIILHRKMKPLSLNTFTGTKSTTPYNKDTFYENDHFNEDKFYDHEKNNNMDNRTTNKKVDVVEENLEVGKKRSSNRWSKNYQPCCGTSC